MKNFKYCLLLLLICSACLSKKDFTPRQETNDTKRQSKITSMFTSEGADAPFIVSIEDSYKRSGRIFVFSKFKALQKIDTKKIKIQLLGFNEEKIVSQDERDLSIFSDSSYIYEGQELAISMEIDGKDVSEYQLHVSWSDKENEEQVSSTESEKEEKLKEVNFNLNDLNKKEFYLPKLVNTKERELRNFCKSKDCFYTLQIESELINPFEVEVSGFNLALSLVWQESGEELISNSVSTEKLEGEEIIDLQNLVLKAGQSRKIRLNIDREIPVKENGKYVPVLRVVSAGL